MVLRAGTARMYSRILLANPSQKALRDEHCENDVAHFVHQLADQGGHKNQLAQKVIFEGKT